MRKYFAVALLVIFVVSVTGLLTLAETVDQEDVVDMYENPGTAIDNYDLDFDGDVDEIEKAIIVTPEAFQDVEDKNYEVKSKGSSKVLVVVDPIHVTE